MQPFDPSKKSSVKQADSIQKLPQPPQSPFLPPIDFKKIGSKTHAKVVIIPLKETGEETILDFEEDEEDKDRDRGPDVQAIEMERDSTSQLDPLFRHLEYKKKASAAPSVSTLSVASALQKIQKYTQDLEKSLPETCKPLFPSPSLSYTQNQTALIPQHARFLAYAVMAAQSAPYYAPFKKDSTARSMLALEEDGGFDPDVVPFIRSFDCTHFSQNFLQEKYGNPDRKLALISLYMGIDLSPSQIQDFLAIPQNQKVFFDCLQDLNFRTHSGSVYTRTYEDSPEEKKSFSYYMPPTPYRQNWDLILWDDYNKRIEEFVQKIDAQIQDLKEKHGPDSKAVKTLLKDKNLALDSFTQYREQVWKVAEQIRPDFAAKTSKCPPWHEKNEREKEALAYQALLEKERESQQKQGSQLPKTRSDNSSTIALKPQDRSSLGRIFDSAVSLAGRFFAWLLSKQNHSSPKSQSPHTPTSTTNPIVLSKAHSDPIGLGSSPSTPSSNRLVKK